MKLLFIFVLTPILFTTLQAQTYSLSMMDSLITFQKVYGPLNRSQINHYKQVQKNWNAKLGSVVTGKTETVAFKVHTYLDTANNLTVRMNNFKTPDMALEAICVRGGTKFRKVYNDLLTDIDKKCLLQANEFWESLQN